MKKLLVSTGIAGLLLIILARIVYAAPGVTDPVMLKELAQVRQATANYHDVNVALGDGLSPHQIASNRRMVSTVNILKPEILLYVKSGNGLKPLGAEYFLGIGKPGSELNDVSQPPHFDLHVWLWQANPAGIFAIFNPNVSCE